jgi:uncharacterized protein with NRDE domain
LIIFAVEQHPRYPFIFAANRDERHDRPTRKARFWKDAPDVLAGRDEVAGGTWCGVTRTGRFAAVSNFRDPGLHRDEASSRGDLVREFLTDERSPRQYLADLKEKASAYNGFNLLVGDLRTVTLGYLSNRGGGPEGLQPGIHGISNHLLNTPWPKVERSRKALADLIETVGRAPPDTEALFDILRSTHRPPDDRLPDTGLDRKTERLVAAPFIINPTYGTRSSTVILLDSESTLTFIEKTYNSEGAVVDTRAYELDIT